MSGLEIVGRTGLARLLGVSESTTRNLEARGEIAPEQIVGYLNKLKSWPGVYGDITFTPELHNGFPDDEVVFCEVNSLRDGAFNLAPGYSA